MKKICVIGSKGMLGHILCRYLKDKGYNILEICRDNFNIKDKNDIYLMINYIKENKCNIIINCIGLLVKASEDNPQLAKLINTNLPHLLEDEFFDTKTKIIHISTDCVFTGINSGLPFSYSEVNFPNETSIYGKTKAEGEIYNTKDLTIRTSIIGPEISNHKLGLFEWFMSQKTECNGYKNVYWNGVCTIELARIIEIIIRERKNLWGLINIGTIEKFSKYELLCLIAETFNKDINIIPIDYEKNINKTLKSDFKYNIKIKNYKDQLTDMKNWINKNKSLYSLEI